MTRRPLLVTLPFFVLLAACAPTVVDAPVDTCDAWQSVAPDLDIEWLPDSGSSVLLGQCLRTPPRLLSATEPACAVLEARSSAGNCVCDPAEGRAEVSMDHAAPGIAFMSSHAARKAGWDCLCEIVQLTGDAGAACRDDPGDHVTAGGVELAGFCYVDATVSPPVGNPEIAGRCPTDRQRLLRFVGGAAITSAELRMVCQPACPITPAPPGP